MALAPGFAPPDLAVGSRDGEVRLLELVLLDDASRCRERAETGLVRLFFLSFVKGFAIVYAFRREEAKRGVLGGRGGGIAHKP